MTTFRFFLIRKTIKLSPPEILQCYLGIKNEERNLESFLPTERKQKKTKILFCTYFNI